MVRPISPGGKFGPGDRQVVNLNIGGGGGGNNSGYGSAINIDSLGAGPNPVESVKMVFMNEWVEILMSLSDGKWNAGDSSGEGLSQYCGIVRFRSGHYSYYGSWVNQWLNFSSAPELGEPRLRGLTKMRLACGCALAFLFYLNTQLNFSINQIIAAGASTLADGLPDLDRGHQGPISTALFTSALELASPSAQPSNLTNDNPFPLLEEQQHVFYRGTRLAFTMFSGILRLISSSATSGPDPTRLPLSAVLQLWYGRISSTFSIQGVTAGISHVFWDAPSNQLIRDAWTGSDSPRAAG